MEKIKGSKKEDGMGKRQKPKRKATKEPKARPQILPSNYTKGKGDEGQEKLPTERL